jgi:protein-disulfide isomerase
MRRIGILLALVLFVGVLTSPGAEQSVVAEVEGEKITSAELENAIAADLKKLQDQIYTLKRQRLEAMINERLLSKEAARLQISPAELLDKEVTSKISLVTEKEIDAFYEANKARINDGPQVREQIRQYLQSQSLSKQRETYFQSLRAKATVVMNLQPPPPLRVAVNITGAPFKGPEKAPVTIVKFEDFQCPFCRQVQGTFAQLESRYGDKLKLVHRDFPIDNIHPLARRAAEAARCANAQGEFWKYHDKLYATALSPDPDQLSALAKEIHLDVAAFDGCLASGKYKAAVQKDFQEGQELGVSATPAFFINGQLIVGSQSLESFAHIIDEELADRLAATAH